MPMHPDYRENKMAAVDTSNQPLHHHDSGLLERYKDLVPKLQKLRERLEEPGIGIWFL